MDGLAVLAGGLIALAGGAAGNRLRGLGMERQLEAPIARIERLEVRLKNGEEQQDGFQRATAEDLSELQHHLASVAKAVENLRPVELVTRLGVVEQSLAAANKDLRRSLDEQRSQVAELASGLEEQRTTLRQAIDGMAQVSMAQDQLTVGLDARLAQLQASIDQAQQQTAQRRVQLGQVMAQPPAGVVAAFDPGSVRSSGSVPLAQPLAQLEELGRATAAAQAEFAARQREAAAAAFAQPAGGGR